MHGLIIGDTPSFGGGQFLSKLIQEVGIDPERIQIATVTKEDVPVRENEMDERKRELEALVQEIRPQYILLMGATAARLLLNVSDLNEVRGRWIPEKNNILCLVTYHPVAALMDESKISGLKRDLEQFSFAVRGRKRWRLLQIIKRHPFRWISLGAFSLLVFIVIIWMLAIN